MKLSIGISPCPNDTFIFDALLHDKIDTGGLEFDYVLEDVETLNTMALRGELDISKVSYGAVPHLLDPYVLLDAGGALGSGVGPLLVSKKYNDTHPVPEHEPIAIPGLNTTAHLLFSLAYPHMQHKVFMPFHEIETAVVQGKVAAGVIIHENRFTYQQKGLHRICDLGEVWEKRTGMPIPLGGIVAKRSLGNDTICKIDRLIRESLAYAFKHHASLPPFVLENAQEMQPDVMRKHINLYVNDYSLTLGKRGRAAVVELLQAAGMNNGKKRFSAGDVFLPERSE